MSSKSTKQKVPPSPSVSKKPKPDSSPKKHSPILKVRAPKNKNIALIYVPCAAVLDSRDKIFAGYVNSFVTGALLRHSRSFDQIRICTMTSMADVFNCHFGEHNFEFQFRGKSYFFPLDKVTSDPLVIDSQNQKDFKKKKCNRSKNFMECQIKSLKSDNDTTLFFFILDHGLDYSVGISFADVFKWLDGIKFNHAVIMSDSYMSHHLLDYIKFCDFIYSNPSVPKQTIISTGRIVRFVDKAFLTSHCTFIDLLKKVNISSLVDYAFDPNVDFYIRKLGCFFLIKKRYAKLIPDLVKRLSGIEDKSTLIMEALSHESIPIGKDLQKALDCFKSYEMITVQQLIDANNMVTSLFRPNSDFKCLCNECRGLLIYLKELKTKYEKDEMKTFLTDFLVKHIPNFNANFAESFPELASFHNDIYDFVDDCLPACINKITVITSTSKKITIQDGFYPFAIEFIAALCIENGNLKSVFDRYMSEIKHLNILGYDDLPQFFSKDPWFYESGISKVIPSFKSSKYSQKFVELLFHAGFTETETKSEEEEEEEYYEYYSSNSFNDPMARLKALPRYSIEGYVPKYMDSLQYPRCSIPNQRGKKIALEFVRFLNWILAKEGFKKYKAYTKITRDTPKERKIYKDYLYFESGIYAGIIAIPFLWNVRKSLSLYLHKHKRDRKDLDIYDVYTKVCYSFDKVVNKYFTHEIKLVFYH